MRLVRERTTILVHEIWNAHIDDTSGHVRILIVDLDIQVKA
jgi:hypothetical protein